MSDRKSAVGSPVACSGDMYAGVPSVLPAVVSVELPPSARAAVIALAMPKSVTTAASPASSTLSGLMSRWTMPWSCA